MFARFLEFTVKPEKKPEMVKKVREEILPILNSCKGFIDLIPLELETEPTKYFMLSFWHDKYEAEKYEKEHFLEVKKIVEPFLTMPITVKLCKVETTIPAKMFAVAA